MDRINEAITKALNEYIPHSINGYLIHTDVLYPADKISPVVYISAVDPDLGVIANRVEQVSIGVAYDPEHEPFTDEMYDMFVHKLDLTIQITLIHLIQDIKQFEHDIRPKLTPLLTPSLQEDLRAYRDKMYSMLSLPPELLK